VFDHSENPKWDENNPYPKVGYLVFYRMDINQVHDFKAQYESAERKLINPNKVKEFYHDWNELFQEILDYALSIY
jgi:8-oxo-dGTP diphosphatase